ncbi:hypothetical protein [Aquabacterium sp. J223]|uniref:hypothetical protein n=1 Tax=Aquabacterium sp. J223 TaxID=2898431 RepID=UPI0021AE14B9|nr:hypothetical protein [Aquabacterium sp. J223]UUX94658.1 hypothetical protein LRS07_15350 [Aquabacterium sp. J223]
MTSCRSRSLPVLLAAAAVLAGCAGYPDRSIQPGISAEQVIARMGPPAARHPAPDGGTRLEYSHPPFGKQSFMVDLDAQGRVTRVEQVLDERQFMRIEPGMTVQQVQALIGRPSERRRGGWQPDEVWSWRHVSPFCTWFQASVDTQGTVTSTGMGPDPMCGRRRSMF